MLWKGGAGQLGRFVFLFTSMPAHSFSPTSKFMGSSIKAKCEPLKKYKGACEKRTREPVKSPYGVGHYYDMAVSPTRSHLLWYYQYYQWAAYNQSRVSLQSIYEYVECSQYINRKPLTFVKFSVFLNTRRMSQIIKWTKAICASAGINDGLKLKWRHTVKSGILALLF